MLHVETTVKGEDDERLKKGIMCTVCVMFDDAPLVSAAAGEIEGNVSGELSRGTNKRPILELLPGDGVGQIGYSGSEQFGFNGPDAFAVEDGIVYILDNENSRVLIYQEGVFSSFHISQCPEATHMKYEQQRLGIVDNYTGVTGVYTTSGSLITLISHPDVVDEECVADLLEVGDSYVVWRTYKGKEYRYDWIEETVELLEEQKKIQFANTEVCVSSEEGNIHWDINAKNKQVEVLGMSEDALIYQQYDLVPDVDIFLAELSVRKVTAQGKETYAILDFSDWYAPALNPLYFSSDGKVFVMECLEKGTVISEVLMGTTDTSRMSELEARAEARRNEMTAFGDGDERNVDFNKQSTGIEQSASDGDFDLDGKGRT